VFPSLDQVTWRGASLPMGLQKSGKKRRRPPSRPVRRPPVPGTLSEMGALAGPLPGGRFDPFGDFQAAYGVWTCHGYKERGNADRHRPAVLRVDLLPEGRNPEVKVCGAVLAPLEGK